MRIIDSRETLVCTTHDLHPFECDGPGECIHCDKRWARGHVPERCALCTLPYEPDQPPWRDTLEEAAGER